MSILPVYNVLLTGFKLRSRNSYSLKKKKQLYLVFITSELEILGLVSSCPPVSCKGIFLFYPFIWLCKCHLKEKQTRK